MLFDYSKLKGKIKEKGLTQEELANKIEIDKSTLSLKINNQSVFTQEEIFKIINILGIAPEEIEEYFFTIKV